MRRVLRLVAAFLIVTASLVIPAASPAYAYPSNCQTTWGAWKQTGSPAWGQWRYCTAEDTDRLYVKVQVDDMLTDGYPVHFEINYTGTWNHVPDTSGNCLMSTGNGETSMWGVISIPPGEAVTIRLIKGSCLPHYNFGFSGTWIIANPN